MSDFPLIRVMALHALGYCERLFYLEEVEEIRVADDRVYAGRTLHESEVDADGEWSSVLLESEEWGIRGKVDFVRYRDGRLVAYEHKIGRSDGERAWRSDVLQVVAYAVLLREHFERPVLEGRVRYHASNKTVRVAVDEAALALLRRAIARARELSATVERPAVAENENLCAKCALAPVCLPEEERAAAVAAEVGAGGADGDGAGREVRRFFPAHDERRIVHLTEHGSRLRRAGMRFVVSYADDKPDVELPGNDVGAFVVHGHAQVTTQALHFAATEGIAVHWLTTGGRYVAGLQPPQKVQRQLRQYAALGEAAPLRLELCRKLVCAKVENQCGLVARISRARRVREAVERGLHGMRRLGGQTAAARTADELRGIEGAAARAYFGAIPALLGDPGVMAFCGRNRRPPRDGFNAALSFGYALLYRDVMAAILSVGLDPCLGFLHTPRSAAHPLALDIMEIFRPLMWDIALIGSVNRGQWNAGHFVRARDMVWLSGEGKKLAIRLYEERRQEKWKHPVLGYSLSYARTVELEVRLLEKEWTSGGGFFAQLRIR